MDNIFELTIVISSYNRDDKVLLSLERLFESDLTGFTKIEVILIDDGSPSPIEKLLGKLKPVPAKIEFKLVTQKNAGIGATRNRGFREAKAPIVIFLDDDILVDPDTINKIYKAQLNGPGPIQFGSYPFISHSSESLKIFARKLYGYDVITEHESFEKVDAITSGLLSVDKAKLKDVENFYKDDLRIPAAEEYEIIARFHKMAIPIYRAGHICATHNHHLELKWLVQQQFKYGQGTAEAYIKYADITDLERFAYLKSILDKLGKPGLKNIAKKIMISAPGRNILFFYCRCIERLSPKRNHNFIFGILASAYFWAGYRDGLKKFS